MSKKTGFFNLEENINSTIYEGLLKLGYQNNESFSIYYDLDLLNYLLQTALNQMNYALIICRSLKHLLKSIYLI